MNGTHESGSLWDEKELHRRSRYQQAGGTAGGKFWKQGKLGQDKEPRGVCVRENQEVNSQRKVEAKRSDTAGRGFRNQKHGEFIQGRKQDRGILRDICDNPGQQ